MGYADNTNPRYNNQNNTSDIASELQNPGDTIYVNPGGAIVSLPIGTENQQMTVESGVPAWKDSYGDAFKISYFSYPENTAWNSTFNENGVPFDQTHLTKYSNAHAIRAEFKTVNSSGAIVDKSTSAQGGNTPANITTYKNNCQELWCTVSSGSYADMQQITNNLGTIGTTAISDITTFAVDNTLSGIDINFEAFGSWDSTFVTNFNTWLGSLQTSLTANNVSLNLDLPYIGNATIAGSYNFDYSSFIDNVDYLTVMMYDVHLDYGRGFPICPLEAIIGGTYTDSQNGNISGNVAFYEKGTLQKFSNDVGNKMQKLIVALPNYGYVHTIGDGDYTITNNITRNKINLNTTYNTVESAGLRDWQSSELFWEDGTYRYRYVDEYALQRKVDAVRTWINKHDLDNPNNNKTRREIVIWHMGAGSPAVERN